MAIQSNDELIRVADEWFRNFCPPNLVKEGAAGARNAQLIAERCLTHNVLTISTMTEAARELAAEGKLALIPQVKQPTPAEIAAEQAKKAEQRMRRDYLESLKPQRVLDVQKLNADKAATAKAESTQKELRGLEAQISREIEDYSASHPMGIDYSRTESGRSTLREVLSQHPNRNTVEKAKQALEAVRNAKRQLN
jgi:hypothetical protein